MQSLIFPFWLPKTAPGPRQMIAECDEGYEFKTYSENVSVLWCRHATKSYLKTYQFPKIISRLNLSCPMTIQWNPALGCE